MTRLNNLFGSTCLTVSCRWCYNSHYARLALLVHIFSWYGMYCLSRTLSNSTEHALLIIGTYFLCRRNKCWQWKFFTFSNFYLSILIAVFSCFVRPTVVLFWVGMNIVRSIVVSIPFLDVRFLCLPLL